MKRLAITMAALSTFAAFSCKGPAAQPQAESKVLVLIDMQNDFIDGSLGSEAAQAIVPNVVDLVRGYDGYIVATRDTHGEDYLDSTLEGRLLPVSHCAKGSNGWQICSSVMQALEGKAYVGEVDKPTFGSKELPEVIASLPGFDKNFEIELVGLDTDICVVSNALSLRMNFPDNPSTVRASCCAGTCPERHSAALETMKSCQINVIE